MHNSRSPSQHTTELIEKQRAGAQTKGGYYFKTNLSAAVFQQKLSGGCMTTSSRAPPSLLKLTIESGVAHIHRVVSLHNVPDMIVLELFRKTLTAGKLTEPVLQMFLATGNESILEIVQSLRIRPVLKPILPTRCSDRSF